MRTDEDKEKKSPAVETQAKNKGEAKDTKEKDTQNKVVERAKEKAGKVVDQVIECHIKSSDKKPLVSPKIKKEADIKTEEISKKSVLSLSQKEVVFGSY